MTTQRQTRMNLHQKGSRLNLENRGPEYDLFLGYLESNIHLPLRTIARGLAQCYPTLGCTVEDWRTRIRSVLDKQGKGTGIASTERLEKLREARAAVEAQGLAGIVPSLGAPASQTHELDTSLVKTWLILSDLHIPAHKPVAVQTSVDWYLDFLGTGKPRGVILNGDLLDCYKVSSFAQDPLMPGLAAEIDYTNAFLDWLYDYVKPAEVIFKRGNHEARLQRYLLKNAPAVYGLQPSETISWENLLFTRQRGMTMIGEDDLIRHEDLFIMHGDETRGGSSSVNPARGAFLATRSCTFAAHNHQTSEHNGGNLKGEMITSWSAGCLCELSVAYKPLAMLSWNHGFGVLDCSKDKWRVHNKRILNQTEVV